MNIFPLVSSPVSNQGTELPLAREVRWDFTKDEPIWHGGNPATVTGAEAVLVWAWNTINTSRYLHDVFTHTYGQDLQSLIGEAYGDDIRQSEAIRCIREALEINPYIKTVHQIDVMFEGSVLHLSFKAKTIYGEVTLNDGKIAL